MSNRLKRKRILERGHNIREKVMQAILGSHRAADRMVQDHPAREPTHHHPAAGPARRKHRRGGQQECRHGNGGLPPMACL